MHCSTGFGKNAIPTVQCYSAKQGHSMHYVTVTTPRKICCSYRCAVSQHQCTAALVLAKCSPHCSVLLCKTGSQHALCHCNYTHEDLLFIQVCSESAPMHCSTGFGKMQSPLFSFCKTGSQHALCHCNYTYEDLLFIQVCIEPAPMHCSTGFGKMQSPLFSVALQNRLTACTMSL